MPLRSPEYASAPPMSAAHAALVRSMVWTLVLVLAAMASSCGGSIGGGTAVPPPSPGPGAPSGPPATPASTTPANVGGNWRGTLDAPGLATRTIVMQAFQTDTCVDAVWRTEPSEWTGLVSGSADVGSFAGSISFQRPADGPGKCAGLGAFSGRVDADTIVWTSPGFDGDCPGGLPRLVSITLHRE